MPALIDTLSAVLVGTAAGLHAATWGMYKDAPHEGFTWGTFLRSGWIGALLGPPVAVAFALDPRSPAGAFLLFGAAYAAERLVHEFYKTFLRREDQSKYFIPMALSVGGRVVRSQPARLTAGALYLAGLAALGLAIRGVERLAAGGPDSLVPIVLVGSAGGWVSALGGVWKDAPIEGFDLRKFFRSPVIALVYALICAGLSRDYLLVAVAAVGFTVATCETYKTFFFPSVPRGKFAGMPVVAPVMLRRRRLFVPGYVALTLAAAAAAILAFSAPRAGIW
jgi:hypothetical protein